MEPIIWLGVLAVLLVIEWLTTHLLRSGLQERTCCRYCSRHWNGNRAAASSVFLCFTGAAVFYKTGSAEAYEKRHRENKCGRSSWKKGCRDPEDQ